MVIYSDPTSKVIIDKGQLLFKVNNKIVLSAAAIYGPEAVYATLLISNLNFISDDSENNQQIANTLFKTIGNFIARLGGKLIFLLDHDNANYFSDKLKKTNHDPTFIYGDIDTLKLNTSRVRMPDTSNLQILSFKRGEFIPNYLLNLGYQLMLEHTWWARENNKTLQDFTTSVQHSSHTYFLLKDRQLIGFVRTLSNSVGNGTLAYGSDFVIHKEYRKKNYGTYLLRVLLNDLDVGVKILTGVASDRKELNSKFSAIDWYLEIGFQLGEQVNMISYDKLLLYCGFDKKPIMQNNAIRLFNKEPDTYANQKDEETLTAPNNTTVKLKSKL